ncbi:hypothetical protein J31TS4_38310 [Paenibacillus sp. J31TS4]|uniref:YvrJ family protein n=1 Tax=Paenibacillus sp. J31TS4 TaxID=2807195 RepID=UPI001B081E9A|nr:YvrJ family protein [Paenibacillus sp. J31TS4]GIP40551.1 hypothetical protein J31TS4_38310 [Paenibacillus sp. J31TS4]
MEQQIITLLTTAIGNFGFPIVITSYLLLRFEKKIEGATLMQVRLEEKIEKLNSTIQDLVHVMKEGARK